MDHKLLRELFRHLQAFEALFENEGIDSLTAPGGEEYCLSDIQYLYECTQRPIRLNPYSRPGYVLSLRQRQAVALFLYWNEKEKDVAVLMGVSDTNPIAIYATQGLKKLCSLINDGQLSRFRPVFEGVEYATEAWSERSTGGDGERVDPPVAGRGDGPLGEVGHPDALEGAGPAEPRGLQLVRDTRPGDAQGDVPPRLEPSALPPELTRWRRAREADSLRSERVRGQVMAEQPGREPRRGLDQLYRLTIRWGQQVRLKCASCTRYVKNDESGHLHCRCGCSYRQVQEDYYEMIEGDQYVCA